MSSSSDMHTVPRCIICGSGKNSMSHYEEEEGGGIIFQSSHRMQMLESLHLQGRHLHALRESLGHLRVLRETNSELKAAMEGSLSHVVNNNTGDATRRAGTMLMKASIAKTYRRNKDQRAVLDALKKKMHRDILAIQTVFQCLDDSRVAGIQQHHQERREVLQQTSAGLRQQCKEQNKILHLARLQLSVGLLKLFSVTVSPCYRDRVCAIAIDQGQLSGGGGGALRVDERLQRSTRGFSYIMDVPLPNDGDYSDVPLDVLVLALNHIAHLVDIASSVLNVPLMHPIHHHHHHLEEDDGYRSTSSSSSISSRTDPDVCHALVQHQNPTSVPRCLDESSYSICYETTKSDYVGQVMGKTVVAHSGKGDPLDNAVDGSTWGRRHSRYGLHLLQQDVLLLCLDCGMTPSDLWPPEALLLNIYALQRFLECHLPLPHSKVGDSDLQLQHDSDTMSSMEERSSSVSSSEFMFHDKPLLPSEALSNTPNRNRVLEAHTEKYQMIDAVRKAMSSIHR